MKKSKKLRRLGTAMMLLLITMWSVRNIIVCSIAQRPAGADTINWTVLGYEGVLVACGYLMFWAMNPPSRKKH